MTNFAVTFLDRLRSTKLKVGTPILKCLELGVVIKHPLAQLYLHHCLHLMKEHPCRAQCQTQTKWPTQPIQVQWEQETLYLTPNQTVQPINLTTQ